MRGREGGSEREREGDKKREERERKRESGELAQDRTLRRSPGGTA